MGRLTAFMKEKFLRCLKYVIPLLILAIVLLLEIYSRSAAMIFNRAMQDQTMLNGTVSVEKLAAYPDGHVFFVNLEWKDPNGKTILLIPDGNFRVSLIDVLARQFSATTIKELTLNKAAISLRLSDDGSVDIISPLSSQPPSQPPPPPKPPKKNDREGKSEEELLQEGERKRDQQRQEMEQEWKNFNRDGRRIAMDLVFKDCHVEVFYRNRQYLMDSVNLKMSLDTKRTAKLKADTGLLGGTMIGDGISFSGTIDFAGKEIPVCDFSVFVDAVDPSSLGFGMDIHDKMTLSVHLTGEFSHLTGNGTIHMDRLRVPALDFSDVDGTILYEDAMVRFDDVSASVYDGTLKAQGWYNIDSRYYHIEGHGTELRTKRALPKEKLFCRVQLDIRVHSEGSVQKTSYEGSFVSGEGRFQRIPFREIQGRFHNIGRMLDFYDVVIDFGGVKAMTDIVSVHGGKLMLAPISITNDAGKTIVVYNPESKDIEEHEAQK